MNNKTFNNMTAEQLMLGMLGSYENANRHYESAEAVHKIGHFGIANSLMILSCEESFKATVFHAKLLNPDKELKVENFLMNHKAKHKRGKLLFATWKHYKDITESQMENITELVKAHPKDFQTRISEMINKELDHRLSNASTIDTGKDDQWWNNANDYKNLGFYLDFRNGDFELPSQITEEIYFRSKEIADAMIHPGHLLARMVRELKNIKK